MIGTGSHGGGLLTMIGTGTHGGFISFKKNIQTCGWNGVYFSDLKVYEWLSFSLQKYINGVSFSPKKYMNG